MNQVFMSPLFHTSKPRAQTLTRQKKRHIEEKENRNEFYRKAHVHSSRCEFGVIRRTIQPYTLSYSYDKNPKKVKVKYIPNSIQ